MIHTIYNGDTLKRVKELENESIHLTVTSPPYFNAKAYNKEDENVGNNKDYIDYLNKIDGLISDIYNKTVAGGIICWNTSPVLDNGKRYGIPFDTHQIFEKYGFEFLEDVIWIKPDGAAKLRCGGWYQNKGKPMTWHANINTEYIMIYKKPGTRKEKPYKPFKTYYNPIPKDILTVTWKINPETQTTWHDAPFPDELVKRCILLYSFEGDIVFDPFLGSGTVMKVARELGRNSVGIELSPEYLEKAKEKLGFYQKNLFSDEVYIEK